MMKSTTRIKKTCHRKKNPLFYMKKILIQLKYLKIFCNETDSFFNIYYNKDLFYLRHAFPKDAEKVNEMEKAIYCEEGSSENDIVNVENLTRWLTIHHKDAFLLIRRDTDTIIGAFGLWPIKPEIFEKIESGEIDDSTLLDSHLESDLEKEDKLHSHWYIGAIEVSKEYLENKPFNRFKRLAIMERLYLDGLKEWSQRKYLDENINLIAIAQSRAGENLLKGYDFSMVSNNESRHNVYTKTFSKNEIEPLFIDLQIHKFLGFLRKKYPIAYHFCFRLHWICHIKIKIAKILKWFLSPSS